LLTRLPALLRPPGHRGPLIASGALLLAVGVLLIPLRFDELGAGAELVILLGAAVPVLGLGLQARLEEGRPPAYQSVLLVTGLVLLAAALSALADLLGADGPTSSSGLLWPSLALAAAASYPAARRGSAVCALIAAVSVTVALLALVDLVLSPDGLGPYRFLLVLVATACVLVSLRLRGSAPRHAVQLVNAAGLAVAALGLSFLLGELPGLFDARSEDAGAGWEALLLACGCGLVAYGAVDREPGPAYLGVVVLGLFTVLGAGIGGGDGSLLWWPLLLVALGGGVVVAGLRPRSPLPPEPGEGAGTTVPLRSRDDDDGVIHVHDPHPPGRR